MIFSVDCENHNHFCECHHCSENEGDCDSDNHCHQGLFCGSNNCDSSLNLGANADCCYYHSLLGSQDFCTTDHPCIINQGDCDSYDDCQGHLACGSHNCNSSLGFDLDVDCCYLPIIGDEHFCTITNPCE